MFESQAFERHMLDEVGRSWITLNDDELLRHWCNNFGPLHIFVRQRLIIKCSLAAQEPFAGGIQKSEGILDNKLRVLSPRVPSLYRFAAGDERPFRFVNSIYKATGNIPVMINHQVQILEFCRGETCDRLKVIRAQPHGLL